MSRSEMMEVVQKLYKQLKKADTDLASERDRRKSRERSLIKLAKELALRKDAINRQMGLNEEVRIYICPLHSSFVVADA